MAKVLVATEKPFAAAAVAGIKEVIEGAGNQLVLLEKYTDKAQLLKVAFEVKPIVKGSPENMVMIYVDLKNVTDKPMMYKMTAILDDKYGGEGIVPVDEQRQKRVAPGEVVTGKIAVTYDKLPTNFVLFIDEETL